MRVSASTHNFQVCTRYEGESDVLEASGVCCHGFWLKIDVMSVRVTGDAGSIRKSECRE
ncbi:hypothetical protein E2C01_055415 [Portunus trituberculatus]|uniref:Uncharacterized protein n=1 Tax=Portunus trituberculatus TaxID=210409 RepID=A0A5B7GV83_PORTR|nr:hypothetical protein [Portunus trituberculatus]